MKALCPALLCLLALTAAAAAQPAPDYKANLKFQKAMADLKQPHRSEADVLDGWKKAFKASDRQCIDCLAHITKLQLKTGEYKDAVRSATDLEALVKSPGNKAYAQLLRGTALSHLNNDKPKPEQLTEADAAFKSASALDPGLRTAQYLDGRVLAQLHRDDEARVAFAIYAKTAPASDILRIRAEHFAENPALARARMAPPFTVTTADGKSFTLDEMGGRVVLVDFWATWCGPCNQELPHIQRIAKDFAGQPFVLISVSWDSDAAKWQQFIDGHGMSWNQYRDADHQLSNAYGVNAIPHTFTIDSDGILQDETIGSGADVEGKLRKLVAKARAAQAAAATPVAEVHVDPTSR